MSNKSIAETITIATVKYFKDLDGEQPIKLYELLLYTAEGPFLRTVYKEAAYNKSKMAKWLGISRGTLRSKLKWHGILSA